ncbi:MAG: ATP synthase subunit I [Chthoniobacterales bacterium]
MTADEIRALALALVGGAGLGTAFFGGLWWTVKKGIRSKNPALLFFASFLIRMALLLIGFFYIGGTRPVRLLVCLFGFALSRALVACVTRPAVPREKL